MDDYFLIDHIDEQEYLDYVAEMKCTKDLYTALKEGDITYLNKFFLVNANIDRFDLASPRSLTVYMLYAEDNNQFEIVDFLIEKGAFENTVSNERCKRYLTYVSDNMRRRRALKKIQNWWIPICYDLNHSKCTSGKRIFERNWQRVQDDIDGVKPSLVV